MVNKKLDIISENALVILNNVYIYPTLYKLNNNGVLLEWHLERVENKYKTISGQQSGLKTTSAWTETYGKNKGKKNETTDEEQADKECLAKYEKKLKSGSYFLNIKDINNKTYIKPMLAETYYSEVFDPETNKAKIKNNIPSIKDFNDGIIIQKKLDGIRMILSKEGAFSRKGEAIQGVPHILESMKEFFVKHPEVILDGELYCHDIEFNVLNGTIRREVKQDTKEQSVIRNQIQYQVYDLINEDIYKNRALTLNNLSLDWPTNVLLLEGTYVTNITAVNSYHNKYVNEGYEGAILRKVNAKYQQGKRTKDLLKVKQFQDAEYTILDIIEGDGNNAGMAAKILINDNGVNVYPNMVGSWDFCRKVLQEKNEYINGETTIKFFGRTPDGSLRHPIVKTLFKSKRDL